MHYKYNKVLNERITAQHQHDNSFNKHDNDNSFNKYDNDYSFNEHYNDYM